MQMFRQTGLRWIWLAVIVLILDQVTKHAVLASFELYDSVSFASFFSLTYVRNYGAAFSFLADAGGAQWYLFTFIGIAATTGLSIWMYRLPVDKVLLPVAFALIIGGAIGNVYDRVMYGYVVDFLDFDFGFYRWPAFNIADMAIVAGAGLLLLESFINPEEKNDEQSKEDKQKNQASSELNESKND